MADLDELDKIISSLEEKSQVTGAVQDYNGKAMMSATSKSSEEILELSKKQASEFKAYPLSHRIGLLEKSIRVLEERESEIPKLYCRESGKPISFCKQEFETGIEIGKHLLKILESTTSYQRGNETEVLVHKPLHHLIFRAGSYTDLIKVVFSSIGSGSPAMILPSRGVVATAYDVKGLLSGIVGSNIAIEISDDSIEQVIDLTRRRHIFMLSADCDFESAASVISERVALTHKPVFVFVDGSVAEPFMSSLHENLKALKSGDPMDMETGLCKYDEEAIGEFLRQKNSVKKKPKFGLDIVGKNITPGLYLAGEFDRHIPNNIKMGPVVAAFESSNMVHGAHFANLLNAESASIFAKDMEGIFEVTKYLDCPFIFTNSRPKEVRLAESILDIMQKKRRLFLQTI
ncbi:aldehyde dehydrogenase family protein [Candidatus Undinarchaeota archaeon]